MSRQDNLEIEHKFLMPDPSASDKIFAKLEREHGVKRRSFSVCDTYFVVESLPNQIFRHRLDHEIEQLTVKTAGHGNEVRSEINLRLEKSKESQEQLVQSFMESFGSHWKGKITKQLSVLETPDFEVVYYLANHGDEKVACFEIEYVGEASVEMALKSIESLEASLGLNPNNREKRSLFELLLAKHAPTYAKRMFA
jgi:adenylate cyclase class IV